MEDKMKQFLQKDLQDSADCIMDVINQDPDLQGVMAPDIIHERLVEQIRKYEQEQSEKSAYDNLSEEDKELIQLGRKYKRNVKRNKYIILAAALVMAMAFGVTSMGGPEKVLEEFRWLIGGRQQVNIDSDDERVKQLEKVNEADAYQQIEDEYGFYPVRLDYLPDGMEFQEVVNYKNTQSIQILYELEEAGVIAYIIRPNYRTSSAGIDVEDELIKEYDEKVDEVTVNVKQYFVEEAKEERWIVEFEYQNVQYLLRLYNVEEQEVDKIIKNLYFS